MGDWPVQDAKARFSAMLDRAARSGPQRVTRHGKPVAVVLAEADYLQLLAKVPGGQPSRTLGQYLLTAPASDFDFDEFLAPQPSQARDLDLFAGE